MKQAAFYESVHDKEQPVRFFRGENGITLPHFHRCIEMLYITEGRVLGVVDGERFYAEKDDVIFARRCAVHELTPSPAYKDYVLIIKAQYEDDFAPLLEKETLPPLLSDKAFNRTLLPLFLELENKETLASVLMTKGYIDVIFGKLLSHYKRTPVVAAPNMSTIVAALNYIDEHYSEPIALETLASVFGYNKYYFSRLFNSYIGENINSYINMVRINNVLALAKKQQKANLCELAYACGFDSMATFYRNYARYYEKPPTALFKS